MTSDPFDIVEATIDVEQLRAPVAPPIVLGTGLNYRRHATECGLPLPEWPMLAFVKPPATVIAPGDTIEIPACCDPKTPEVDWEVELAVVIGRHADNATHRRCIEVLYTATKPVGQ